MANTIRKIIFVCTGNTCISPMAECLYKSMLRPEEDFEIISRGLIVLFSEPFNPKAELVLNKNELRLDTRCSRQFKRADVCEGAIVLTMTQAQKSKINTDYGIFENVYTIKEYAGENGDVTDPYGGSLLEYEECFGELARLVKKVYYKVENFNSGSR